MFEDFNAPPPYDGWGGAKQKNKHAYPGRERYIQTGFTCLHCGAYVLTLPGISGVQNRNHCPFCLWSRHVDHLQAGDRMSACKASMQPIGLALKPGRNKYACRAKGELMLIHRCSECGKLSINRIAADDQAEMVIRIYSVSLALDDETHQDLKLADIQILSSADECTVLDQLYGLQYERISHSSREEI